VLSHFISVAVSLRTPCCVVIGLVGEASKEQSSSLPDAMQVIFSKQKSRLIHQYAREDTKQLVSNAPLPLIIRRVRARIIRTPKVLRLDPLLVRALVAIDVLERARAPIIPLLSAWVLLLHSKCAGRGIVVILGQSLGLSHAEWGVTSSSSAKSI